MSNRRKKKSNFNLGALVVLIACVAIVATGGVAFVVAKNKQVAMQRELAAIQKRMEEHRVAITVHEADIEKTLGVFRLRENLRSVGSSLQPIPSEVVEVFRPGEGRAPPGEPLVNR